MLLALLLLLQTTPQSGGTLANTLNRLDPVMDAWLSCGEKGAKDGLKRRIDDPNVGVIADEAISACLPVESQYRVIAEEGLVAGHMADAHVRVEAVMTKARSTLRSYVSSYVQGIINKPEFAERRLDIMITKWKICVMEKAETWATLNDEAASIATGSMAACRLEETHTRSALSAYAASKVPNSSLARETAEKIWAGYLSTVQQDAVGWTLAKRAEIATRRKRPS